MERLSLGRDEASPFRAFKFRSGAFEDNIETVIHDCLEMIQAEVPDTEIAKSMTYPVVVSALASVGVWPQNLTRSSILEVGSFQWGIKAGNPVSLERSWNKHSQLKKVLPFFPEITQNRWSACRPPWATDVLRKKMRDPENVDMLTPQDGPREVWGVTMHPSTGRRCILSYVHDKACDRGGRRESEVVSRADGRRAVRLTREETSQVSRPHFFNSGKIENFKELWHDGMKYPSPDGAWNSYAGVVPYMLPGSAVWHLVPRIRESSARNGYPSTAVEHLGKSQSDLYDNIIFTYSQLRTKEQIRGLDGIIVKPATDKPVRDLSGVLRLWMMAEATCGMLRDDVIISIQDMAGLALTFMHYDKMLMEMTEMILRVASDDDTKVKRKKKLLCIKPEVNNVKWADLCKSNEGSIAVIRQTMEDAGCENDPEAFLNAVVHFLLTVEHLKFWYALLLAQGQILDQGEIRFEILEDLAKAPAWEEKDRAKVYFMIEAALINRTERNIPYEESIQRFLRARETGGKLLLESINVRSRPVKMEMTRSQLLELASFNKSAELRQPGTFKSWDKAMKHAWMSGTPGLSYVGRFTTSYSKPLYIEAAQAWTNMNKKDIVEMATMSKKRMVVLLTEDQRMFRKADLASKTMVTMCTIFYMDEDQYNLALASFGDNCFHAEKREFRGVVERTDAFGNAIDFRNRRGALCAADHKGNFFEINYPDEAYQIVVTNNIEEEDSCHLAAIRTINIGDGRASAAVSHSEVLRHMNGPERNKLLTMRPDRMSPDGVNIVDYSFEYGIFWADMQGRACTNANTGDESASEVVRNAVKMLRDKHWDSVHVSAESVIGSDSD